MKTLFAIQIAIMLVHGGNSPLTYCADGGASLARRNR